MAIFGLSAGTNPTKELTNFSVEYLLVRGSIICAVPVLPATLLPLTDALLAVPPSSVTVFKMSLNVSAVLGEITLFASYAGLHTSSPSGLNIWDTTWGVTRRPPLAMAEYARNTCRG